MKDCKNIVICCDGTRNSPGTFSNLWRLSDSFQHIEGKQLRLYLQGVGAAPFVDNWLGSPFGLGMSNAIRAGYKFLLKHYKPNDRIFLFGFSRGAYAVRSLANVLNIFGLPDEGVTIENTDAFAKRVYWTYRFNRIGCFGLFKRRLEALFAEYKLKPESEVEFLGVWDTVGSVQLPMLSHWYNRIGTGSNIKKAVQAVSLDETRRAYSVHLLQKELHSNCRNIEEVWFAGDHGDIGGSHEDDASLSKIPLSWMMHKLPASVLLRNDAPQQEYGDAWKGKLHDMTTTGLFRFFTKQVRTVPPESKIHVTVLEKIRNGGYTPRPLNLISHVAVGGEIHSVFELL